MFRRFKYALGAGALALVATAGLTVSTASASTLTTTPHTAVAPPSKGLALHAVPGATPNTAASPAITYEGPFYIGSQDDSTGADQQFINDYHDSCSTGAPVYSWTYAPGNKSEEVYFAYQANGYATLHFETCVGTECIYQYGVNGSYNNLYLHPCSGTDPHDLYYVGPSSGNYYRIVNEGGGQDINVNTPQSQLTTRPYNSSDSIDFYWQDYSI